MAEGFYKINGEVLKFKIIKDLNKILFNHYICQKENLQRIRGDLPKGQFYMTIRNISKDLNISFGEARGLIEKFTQLGIITNAYTPPKGSKKPSIWQYNSVFFTNTDDNTDDSTDDSTDSNTEKARNINGYDSVTNTDDNTDDNTDINTSKKENIKREYKKEIYIDLNFIDDVIDKVKISKSQYDKLINKFGKDIVHKNIIGLDNYIANGKGNKYKDHYRALNTWCSKERKDKSDSMDGQTVNSWEGMKQFN